VNQFGGYNHFRMKSNKNKEKAIEKQLCEYLSIRGCFPCKIDNTGIYNPTRKSFMTVTNKFKRKGTSDVFFFWKHRVYFMEIKTPEKLGYIERNFKKLEQGLVKSQINITRQIEFLKECKKGDQVGFFCADVNRLKEIMEQNPSNVPFY